MIRYEKQDHVIVQGHRPTTDLDRNSPPAGGSVITRQLKMMRQTLQKAPKTSAHKHEK